MPVIQHMWIQEALELKVILDYMSNLRPTWPTCNPVSEELVPHDLEIKHLPYLFLGWDLGPVT